MSDDLDNRIKPCSYSEGGGVNGPSQWEDVLWLRWKFGWEYMR